MLIEMSREQAEAHPWVVALRQIEAWDVDAPTVSLDPDGDMGMDWHRGKNDTVSVSVSLRGCVSWAALCGGKSCCGSFDAGADDLGSEALRAALSAPEPDWQSEPPTEAGWYWVWLNDYPGARTLPALLADNGKWYDDGEIEPVMFWPEPIKLPAPPEGKR